MSYLQGLLNKRLGLKENPRINESIQPKPLLKQEVNEEKEIKTQEIETVETPEPLNPPPQPKKNARGAGRKRITPEEMEKRKKKVVDKYKKQVQDKEIVDEIKQSVTKEELKEEILNHKKKLQLLSDAFDSHDS